LAAGNIFGIHAQVLNLRGNRAELLAKNLANADTPNYKAQDLDFNSAFNAAKTQQTTQILRTHGQHQGGQNATTVSGADLKYRIPGQASLDGNTVDVQMEKSEFADNSVRYLASLSFLNKRINGLIKALREE
jgi:flagellar basal-body rod protein FlgB